MTIENTAKDLVEELDLNGIIMIAINRDGTIHLHADGPTTLQRVILSRWGENMMSTCMSAVPFRTVFGCGNNGVAQPLSGKERSELGSDEKEWVTYIETGFPLNFSEKDT